MHEIAKYWEKTFYTGAISLLLAAWALFISLQKYRKHPGLKPLSAYLLVYVLGQLVILFVIGIGRFSASEKYRIFFGADLTVTLIEFLAFFYVIRNASAPAKLKRWLDPLLPVFLGGTLIYFLYYTGIHKMDGFFLQVLFTFEASFLMVACGFYYAHLFTSEPKFRLTIYPSFWAVTGIAFFMLCTLPFSIMGLYLVNAKHQLFEQLFAIFEIFYWILFLMLIKAYSCKPATAQRTRE